MKIYISVDIEGVAGVTDIDHTRREGKDYEIARRLMTKEVDAAASGAFKGGASEVVVNDSHGSMINLITEELDERIIIVYGSPKPLAMLQGIQGCDAAFFIGYHSCAGTLDAVLDHTYNGRVIYDMRVNDESMGELGINAALAGYFGIPIVLVTGDRKTTDEASHLLKNVEIVPTKVGIGRFAAQSLHPARVREEIKKKGQKALESMHQYNAFVIEPPLRLEMDVLFTHLADRIALIPDIERMSGRAVAYECDDFLNLYQMMRAMILIASTGVL